jgi:hypothetical protein
MTRSRRFRRIDMTTARTLAILMCVATSLLGSAAEAKKHKKAPAPAAAEAPATEESGEIAPGTTTKSTTAERTAEPAAPEATPSAAPVTAQASDTAEEEPERAPARPAPKLVVVDSEAPAIAPAPPIVRKSTGNADSPEGVTWKASNWDVTLYGYAGLNVMQDSTQSFGTASGNTIIQHRGTVRGNSIQAQATARDSRIGMRLAPPTLGSVRASVNIETDFNAPAPIEYTEANSVTQAGLRMRHYYMKVETPIVDILAGQYHDLFGWGGKGFYPSTLAFLGITGEVYHRQPQIRLSKTLSSPGVEVEVAGAALRPVQKNGGYPDIEAGLRVAFNNWTGARQQAYGQPGIGALAFGVSAIGRHFEVAQFLETPGATVSGTGYGIVGNAFIPVIPARTSKDRGNSLSLTGEYSRGTGIADMYSDLTGGLLFPALPNSMDRTDPTNPPPVYAPNIDSGIVTFDGDRRLRTANWEGFVANLQYYLPVANGRIWIAGTHSQVRSSNIKEITPLPGWGGIYTHSWYFDGTVFVAITDQIQMAFGVQKTYQLFGDGVNAWNWRTEFGMNMFF